MEYGTEKNGVRTVAELAVLAARTAPKSHGVDHFEIALASKEEIKAIGERMIQIGVEKYERIKDKDADKALATKMDWHTDGECCGNSDEIILIGVNGRKVSAKNCGLCGYATCAEFLKHPVVDYKAANTSWDGPYCTNVMVDLGIAVSSAASVLIRHHVDNRMFFKVGIAARDLGLMPKCNCIIALAMSATGKNSYFDRPEKLEALAIQKRKGAY